MSRPRTTEDLEELQLRARLRLERRRIAVGMWVVEGDLAQRAVDAALVREAAALVAAIDARLSENMERFADGDR